MCRWSSSRSRCWSRAGHGEPPRAHRDARPGGRRASAALALARQNLLPQLDLNLTLSKLGFGPSYGVGLDRAGDSRWNVFRRHLVSAGAQPRTRRTARIAELDLAARQRALAPARAGGRGRGARPRCAPWSGSRRASSCRRKSVEFSRAAAAPRHACATSAGLASNFDVVDAEGSLVSARTRAGRPADRLPGRARPAAARHRHARRGEGVRAGEHRPRCTAERLGAFDVSRPGALPGVVPQRRARPQPRREAQPVAAPRDLDAGRAARLARRPRANDPGARRCWPRQRRAIVLLPLWLFTGRGGEPLPERRRRPKGPSTSRSSRAGTLQALRSVTYASSIQSNQAKIVAIAPEGKLVQKGDLLLLFDAAPFEEEIRRSEALLGQAQADLEKAQQDLKLQAIANREELALARQKVERSELELKDVQEGKGKLARGGGGGGRHQRRARAAEGPVGLRRPEAAAGRGLHHQAGAGARRAGRWQREPRGARAREAPEERAHGVRAPARALAGPRRGHR